MKKIQGFVLNFGYVESLSPCRMIIVHTDGFDTLDEALIDLANYFFEDYYDACQATSSLDGFRRYLRDLVTTDASNSFCVAHWNNERWWPWDALHKIYKELPFIYENIDEAHGVEDYLPWFVTDSRFKDKMTHHAKPKFVSVATGLPPE